MRLRLNIPRLTFGPHFRYTLVLYVCHITEHGEYNKPCKETGEKVYRTGEYGIPITVVVELIVAGQGEESAKSRTQREKDLRRSVYPHLIKIKYVR